DEAKFSYCFFGTWARPTPNAPRARVHRAIPALLKPMAARTIVNWQCNPGGNNVQGIARRADHAVSRSRAGRGGISRACRLANRPGNPRVDPVRHDRRVAGPRR